MTLRWRTDAVVRRVSIITARARIGARHKHKRAWKVHCIFGTGNGNLPILKGLAQHFKRCFVKLWQLISKQNAVMCKTYLTWLWRCAASYQRYLRDCMVRSTERALGYERRVCCQLACNGVYLRCLQAFCQRQRRQNARQTLRHHALARAWRTHHYEVMTSRRGYFHCPLHVLLTFYIGEIKVELILLLVENFACIKHQRLGIALV